MGMNHLWDKDRYSAKIEFIIDNFIREYDITKANISVLRDANVLSEEQYMYFMSAPKMEREVAIGKMQGSNTKITEILKSGIKNAKRVFMESNGIQDSEILYIHIGTERIKGKFVKGGGDSEFLVDLNKMSIIDEWINQK